MMFANNQSAPLTFPFCIECLIFIEIFWKFIRMFADGNLSLICLLSSNNWLIFPSSHYFNRLSNAIRWSRAFEFLLDFCRSKAGIICIALSAILFRGVPLVHWSKSLVVSLINFLPEVPVGTIEHSNVSKQSVHKLLLISLIRAS